MFELFKTVGNNRENREEDVFSVKEALRDFGHFDFGSSSAEPHGIFTRDLDEGIKGFQSENGLRVDGILNPKGETERAINRGFVVRKPKEKRPDYPFTYVREPQSEFDATGRRIREKPQSIFEDVALSFPNPQRPFSEEAIKKKLQEWQVKQAAATPSQGQSSSTAKVPVPKEKPTVCIPQYPTDQTFDDFRKNLRPREGGVANRPSKADPGGLTNKGMSQKALDDLRKAYPKWKLPSKPTQLTDQQITDIFRYEYYERPQIGKMDSIAGPKQTGSKLIEHVFDASIMTNSTEVGKWLQQSIDEAIGTDLRVSRSNGKKEYDGVLGSQTRAALKSAVFQGKTKDINTRFSNKRIQYLRSLSNYQSNKNGWEARVKNLRD